MIYISGIADHKIDDDKVVDHVVELVEARAREISAGDPLTDAAAQ
jgi:(E)-4-hydroxy-3-methylbut-2-enyl-diphosphate synthase